MNEQLTVTAGIDGSPESLAAAAWAGYEALRRDLPLHLIHAYDQPSVQTRLPEVDVPFHRESDALNHAVLHLSDIHPDLGIVEEQVIEPPVRALLAAAESSALLVLGSRGFGALTGALVGSVALAVAAQATCPVVLVRAGERPDDRRRAPDRPRPVVLGLDLDRPCDELLEFAFVAATTRQAPLHAVHTWTIPLVPTADTTDPSVAKSRLLAATLTPWKHKFPGVQVTERLVRGLTGHHVLQAAKDADLLVVGRRVPAGEHLGSTAHAAIHRAGCPVAIVPHN
ncbi:universal stress protein [Streptomyces formicae]|uniref:Universal stress protein family n=1 Tax=Streptomyces formicae TaxID=1616117 RepID=A0A291QK80_9ACTN|nr:universal stress protein [Streptomyces formicae]ATL32230.1 Universal stress protein family [Streptomyces formicae]